MIQGPPSAVYSSLHVKKFPAVILFMTMLTKVCH